MRKDRVEVRLTPRETWALFQAIGMVTGEARAGGEMVRTLKRASAKLESELIARDLPTHDDWTA